MPFQDTDADMSSHGHTVVIPLYNKAAYIGDAIASLAVQEVLPCELIIVDDASTDDSLSQARAALSRHAEAFAKTRIKVIALDRNGGPGAARNAGLDRATGETISCLDADDSYRPDALRRVAEAMRDHDLQLLVIGFDSEPSGERFPDLDALGSELVPLAQDLFLLPAPMHTAGCPAFFMGRASNVVVRRACLAAHRYHATSRLNEGIDFWYRVVKDIAAQCGRVGLIETPLIRFRILDDSLSHRPFTDWRAFEVPPTILRCLDSTDADDQRLVTMLGQRWCEHAMYSLSDAAQQRAFLDHHRALLQRIGVEPLETAGSPA